MGSKNKKHILLRYALVIAGMFLLSLAIVYKAIDATIIHAAEWNNKADTILTISKEVMPERGDILACDGSVLATSMTFYQAVIDFKTPGFDSILFEKELPNLSRELAYHFPKRKAADYEASLKRGWKTKHQGFLLFPEVTGKDAALLSSLPFLKEKSANTGFYINKKDGGYVAHIDFGVEAFDDSLFFNNLTPLCQKLGERFPKKSAEEYKRILLEAYSKQKNNKGKSIKPLKLLTNLAYSESRELPTFPFLKEAEAKTGFFLEKAGGKSIKREKPYGSMASRAIGSLNSISCRGSSGLEMALDSLLFGVPGKTEKRQLPNKMTDWVEIPAQRGMDVKTTIDVDIQDITEKALLRTIDEIQPQFAVAIVMEVATGEIKAISNLTRLNSGKYSEECRNNAVLPYEPGSVVKALTMMIALDDGVVTPNEKLNGHGGCFVYNKNRITDTGVHDDLNVTNAMTYSSNIGLAQIALKGYEKNPNRFVERIREVGFMEPFNLGIAGESLPQIKSLKNDPEGRSDLASMSFGYTTSIPPIYTLALYNAIANDGKFVRPQLVKELIRDGVTDTIFGVSYIREQMCKPSTAKTLQHMLYTVVESGTGIRAASKKVKIAGKTGTAKLIEGGKYINKYRITFCGYFPYENPQYSCIVLLERPKYEGMPSAGRYCGGTVRDIAETLYSMGRLNTTSLPDSVVAFNPGVLQGDIVGAREVLQQLGVRGDVTHCSDLETVCDIMPDVRGLGARDALYILEKSGLSVSLQGRGKVVGQSIAQGSPIQQGTTVILKLN